MRMSTLLNFSIGKRLAVVLAAIVAIFLLGDVAAIYQLRTLAGEMRAMTEDNLRTERAGSDWLRHTTAGVQRASAIAKSDDTALVAYFAPFTAESIRLTNDLQKLIESKLREPAERQLYDEASTLRKTYLAAREEVSKLKLAGDREGAERVFKSRFEPTSASYLAAVQKIVDLQRAQLDAAAQRGEAARERVSTLLVACAAISAVLGALLAWLLARSITRPLASAARLAHEVAGGNLAARMQARGSDETAQVLRALDKMSADLAVIVTEVRQGTGSIASASGQIASGNQELSSRTEEQASSLQQTAASIAQLTTTVQRNADSTREADQLAAAASELARGGGSVVDEVVRTMGSIQASSKRIADISGVIDGIAFQTNILALNAAVEAARAGEQGRGFAVVASEVRSLAQRSAEAAREIKGLIEDATGTVQTGTKLAGQAGASMAQVVSSVQRVSQIIAEIARASGEQSDGITQVNHTIAQMDSVTQQNAALVEQVAAASDALRQQADRLVTAVDVFRLEHA